MYVFHTIRLPIILSFLSILHKIKKRVSIQIFYWYKNNSIYIAQSIKKENDTDAIKTSWTGLPSNNKIYHFCWLGFCHTLGWYSGYPFLNTQADFNKKCNYVFKKSFQISILVFHSKREN